ncbi:hypothetical protein EMPG_13497 [Blastomyces silverae]|uniref:Autophagy-related protein 14 n=1 Tax=Blastomyces silverae TaxID=2060906 RepID=A0A0H1BI53_9EURO|nr:hypothetical protein EMPG_13497 [Blastomyces silverae]
MTLFTSTDDLAQRLQQLSTADSQRRKPRFSNRKLRHLQGISVRNLVVNYSTPSRRKTIDDDNAPNALQSPAKRLAMHEHESRSSIHQSRSFTDLKRSGQIPSTSAAATASPFGTTGSENEKERNRDVQVHRRRNTLPWAGAAPFIRQRRLENIAGNRMADSWFSLHCAGMDQPVYVSEVVERAMNPNFKYFDLNICGPLVSRLEQVTYKLWAKTGNMTEYILLLRLEVNLRSLQYIGKTLESFHHPLPANCIVFHFQDGVYTSLTDIPPVQQLPASITTAAGRFSGDSHLQSTSSYDALMRLANLDDCIQDALATREKLETQINAILEKNHSAIDSLSRKSQAIEKLSSVKRATTSARKQLRQSKQLKEEIQRSLEARRDAMARGRASQEKTKSYLSEAQSSLSSSEDLLQKTTEDSMGQIRRICEDLQAIYPIEPIPEKPLAFTICSRALPNSTFEDMDKECIAAALGYTAHLVYLLSFYLSVPLPYPVQPYLSHSFIQDPISAGLPQRTFPLYPINAHYRFEYGVFLLNKNIEYLMNRMGLRVIDVRHTLPNLKYLLYILTAGKSELPARQGGGFVRGLLLGARGLGRGVIRSGFTSPSMSRRGSEDSVASGVGVGVGGSGIILGNASTSASGSAGAGAGAGARRMQENVLTRSTGEVDVDRRLAGDGRVITGGGGNGGGGGLIGGEGMKQTAKRTEGGTQVPVKP